MATTEPDANPVQGACLCGAVSVTLKDARPEVSVCHCDMCRRWGGGPFLGVSGRVSQPAGHEIAGADALTVYRSSDWAERAFCGRCGSHIYYRYFRGDHYSFTAGLFAGADGFPISEQIFIDEKPSYYSLAEDTETLTGAEVKAKYGIGG